MSVLAEILNCSSNSNNLSGVVSVSDAEDFCRIMLSFLLITKYAESHDDRTDRYSAGLFSVLVNRNEVIIVEGIPLEGINLLCSSS